MDLVSGVLTVDRVYKSLTDNWSVASNGTFYLDGKATDGKAGIVNFPNNILCNMYPNGYCGGATSVAVDHPQTICTQELNGIRFIIYDSSFSDITAFNTYIASHPIQLVYELATPLTIQLTPTQVKSLLGVNNVWADTGETEVEYFAKEVSA